MNISQLQVLKTPKKKTAHHSDLQILLDQQVLKQGQFAMSYWSIIENILSHNIWDELKN